MKIFLLTSLLLISSLSYAFEPAGKYTFAEPGFSGEMVVNESPQIPRIMKMALATDQKMSGHTCNVAARGERFMEMGDEITEKFTTVKTEYEDEVAEFYVTFTPYGATIKDLEDGKHSMLCGMNGSFTGKWTKDGVKQPAKKDKSKEATDFCSEYIRIKKDCYKKAKKGMFPDKAIASLKKTKIPEEARDDACRGGFSAYGRAGNVKESDLNIALQNEFAKCHEQLTKED